MIKSPDLNFIPFFLSYSPHSGGRGSFLFMAAFPEKPGKRYDREIKHRIPLEIKEKI